MDACAGLILSLLVGLLGLVWFFVRPRPTPVAKETAARPEPRCPVTSSTPALDEPRPPDDPIHQFADGERRGAPVMCPFMAAFQSAQHRSQQPEGDGDREEEDPALQQLKDFMSGYESYREKKEAERERQQGEGSGGDLDSACNTMLGHIKRLEQEKLILQLTEEEKEAEERARETQLAEIYALMRQQEDKFGIGSVTEMHKQMRLYVT